jgi:hypothetical protein
MCRQLLDKARGLAAVLSAEDADLLVAAALLHDVGYAPSLNRLGFHAVDGARFLRAQGQERLARLVAHHAGARFEAEERGLVEELAAFPVEDGPVMDALTFADMTTGPPATHDPGPAHRGSAAPLSIRRSGAPSHRSGPAAAAGGDRSDPAAR